MAMINVFAPTPKPTPAPAPTAAQQAYANTLILQAKQEYTAAQQSGNKAAMAAASQKAELAR